MGLWHCESPSFPRWMLRSLRECAKWRCGGHHTNNMHVKHVRFPMVDSVIRRLVTSKTVRSSLARQHRQSTLISPVQGLESSRLDLEVIEHGCATLMPDNHIQVNRTTRFFLIPCRKDVSTKRMYLWMSVHILGRALDPLDLLGSARSRESRNKMLGSVTAQG